MKAHEVVRVKNKFSEECLNLIIISGKHGGCEKSKN